MNLWVKGILDISLRKLLTNTCISSFILQTLARQNLLLSAFGKFEHLLRTALFLGWTLRFARLLPHNDLRAASLIKRHLKVLLPQLIVFVSILMLFGFAFFGIFLRLSAELFLVFPWNVIGFKFSDLSPVFDLIFYFFLLVERDLIFLSKERITKSYLLRVKSLFRMIFFNFWFCSSSLRFFRLWISGVATDYSGNMPSSALIKQ